MRERPRLDDEANVRMATANIVVRYRTDRACLSLPVPHRGRLQADEESSLLGLEPHVPLDRLENPGPRLLLCTGSAADLPVTARTGAPKRTSQHQSHARRTRRHSRDPRHLPPSSGSARLPHCFLPHPNEPPPAAPVLSPRTRPPRPRNSLGHTSVTQPSLLTDQYLPLFSRLYLVNSR